MYVCMYVYFRHRSSTRLPAGFAAGPLTLVNAPSHVCIKVGNKDVSCTYICGGVEGWEGEVIRTGWLGGFGFICAVVGEGILGRWEGWEECEGFRWWGGSRRCDDNA